MCKEPDRGRIGVAGDGGQHDAVVGQFNVLRADCGQFIAQQVQHIELDLGARRCW